MLILPPKGFARSVNVHNVRLDILVEWIEGSIAFSEEGFAQSHIVDVLCENNVYVEQDFASELLDDAWLELNRRQQLMGRRCPWRVNGRRISRLKKWQEVPTYSFCLLLSLQAIYKKWAKQFGSNYTVQGALFERLTTECLEHLGWVVHQTGWEPGKPSKIKSIVEEVCSAIREPAIPGELEKWISDHANEEGLDLVCVDPFADGWGGRPLYFLQCASGADWVDKTHTPDINTWRKVISFTNDPAKAFAIPFALLEDEFRRKAGKINGLFLDRFRLHAPSEWGKKEWVSKDLTRAIKKWVAPRIKKLPLGDG